MAIAKEIDAGIRSHRIKNDSDLARKMNVSRTAVSRWRSGERIPEPAEAHRLANILGIDPLQFMLACAAEREKDDATRSAWHTIARRLAAAATVTAMTIANYGFSPSGNPPAKSGTSGHVANGTTHYTQL